MTDRSHFLAPDIYHYVLNMSLREHPVLKELRTATATLPAGQMMTGPDQAQFLALLVKLMAARYTLDIGTFTGHSALSVALALPQDGRVITCDIDKKCTAIAKVFWKKAAVSDKIILKLAPALATLDELLNAGYKNHFDFVFIDADKQNNDAYYEKSLPLVRTGGLIAIDNVLWYGRVIHDDNQEKSTNAIRVFNQKLFADTRVEISMLPIGDGLTLARKVR